MKISQITLINFALGVSMISGCAEWRTTPDMVDAHHGLAVRQMIENQTLYPEHAEQEQQVMTLDGRKAQGVLDKYRSPETKESSESKRPVEINLINR